MNDGEDRACPGCEVCTETFELPAAPLSAPFQHHTGSNRGRKAGASCPHLAHDLLTSSSQCRLSSCTPNRAAFLVADSSHHSSRPCSRILSARHPILSTTPPSKLTELGRLSTPVHKLPSAQPTLWSSPVCPPSQTLGERQSAPLRFRTW